MVVRAELDNSAQTIERKVSKIDESKKMYDYMVVLVRIPAAEDVDQLASCEEIMRAWDLPSTLSESKLSQYTSLADKGLLRLLITAAMHIMAMAVKLSTATVLLSTAVLLLACLTRDLEHVIRQVDEAVTGKDQINDHLQRSLISDLLPAMTGYTRFITHVLESLASESQQMLDRVQRQQRPMLQEEQQQLEEAKAKLAEQHCAAAVHAKDLLGFWRSVLYVIWVSPYPAADIADSLSAAIQLAAFAVPLLSKGLKLSDSNNTSSKSNSAGGLTPNQQGASALFNHIQQLYQQTVYASDNFIQMISTELEDVDPDLLQGSQLMQPRRQQQQQILLSNGLPELVLLLLANQAAGLQTLQSQQCFQGPAAAVDQKPAVVRRSQQSAQQHCRRKHQGLRDSSRMLLAALGVPPNVSAAVTSTAYKERPCREGINVLLDVNHERREAMRKAVNHNSRGRAHAEAPGQQQLSSDASLLFPQHLTVPAVRVLIEVALLLPGSEAANLVPGCLGAVLLLLSSLKLHESLHPQQPHPQSPTAPDRSSDSAAAVNQDIHTIWPAVPRAVAAGLLQPVLQLLSRAVVQSLAAATRQQQQQHDEADEGDEADDYAQIAYGLQARMLSGYGMLLMDVCSSVEPKHIAAVLRPDPITPLIAMEAVIRCHAYRLLPDISQQAPQQQLPSEPEDDYHGPGQLAADVLPFVTKVFCALKIMLQDQHTLVNLDRLIGRMCSLTATACKVGRIAAVRWQKQLRQTVCPGSLSSQFLRAHGASTAVPASEVQAVSKQVSINSWYTTGAIAIASIAATLSAAIRTQTGTCDSRDSRQHNHLGVDLAESVASTSAETRSTCPTGSSQSFSISSSDTGRLHSFLLVMLLRAADACVLQLRAEDQGLVPCSADASRTKAAAADSQAAATDPASGSALVASSSIPRLRAIGHLLLSATAVLQHMPAKLDLVAAGEGDVVNSSTRQHCKQSRQQQQRPLQQLRDLAHDYTIMVYCQPFGDSGK